MSTTELIITELKKVNKGRPKKVVGENNDVVIDEGIKEEVEKEIKAVRRQGRHKYIPTEEEIAEELRKKELLNLLPKRTINRTPKEEAEVIAYRKKYYAENKEKYMGEIPCYICQIRYCKANRSRHIRSKQHMQNLSKIKMNELEEKLKAVTV